MDNGNPEILLHSISRYYRFLPVQVFQVFGSNFVLPFIWVTQYAKTYNEHWVEEQRPSPNEFFPPYPYFQDLFDLFDLERIVWIEKSRDLMISWACVAYLTLNAMRVPHRGVLFQTQKMTRSSSSSTTRSVCTGPSRSGCKTRTH
jgi:hypothetical protein